MKKIIYILLGLVVGGCATKPSSPPLPNGIVSISKVSRAETLVVNPISKTVTLYLTESSGGLPFYNFIDQSTNMVVWNRLVEFPCDGKATNFTTIVSAPTYFRAGVSAK